MRRSSHNAQAVTAGLELGWLAFACDRQKRRLAPIPPGWQAVDDAELERLCGMARVARPSSLAVPSPPTPLSAADDLARPRVPRIRRARIEDAPLDAGELPIASAATSADPVEDTVRTFAHQARSHRLPAIEAMVRLKTLLARVYPGSGSPARDLRAVRRWFVEAYYFDRAADASAGEPDQSR